MRHNELSEGIDVLDSNGNVVGSSRIAAKHVRMLVTVGTPHFNLLIAFLPKMFFINSVLFLNQCIQNCILTSYVALLYEFSKVFFFFSGADRNSTNTSSPTTANLCPSTNHNGLLGKVWSYFFPLAFIYMIIKWFNSYKNSHESLLLLSSARLPLMQAHRRMMLPVHSLVCLAVFGLSLPLAISLFPQMSQVLQQHLHHFLYSTANNCCSRFNFVCHLFPLIFSCVCVCVLNNKYFSRE